jgi:hypothetical protein
MHPDPDLQSLGGETLYGDQDELMEAGSSKQYYCKFLPYLLINKP